jgi:hypothetical protein
LRALRLCRLEEDLAVAAERALQRTDDLIGKARDSLTAHPNDRATTTLERAVETQNRARVEFGAGRFEPCLRLTQQARTLAQRSLRSSGGAL